MDRFSETDAGTFAARRDHDDWKDEPDDDTGCTPREMTAAISAAVAKSLKELA